MNWLLQTFQIISEPRHRRVDWFRVIVGCIWMMSLAFYYQADSMWLVPGMIVGLLVTVGGLAELLPRQWKMTTTVLRLTSLLGLILVIIYLIVTLVA
jgi:hypothetical protein